MTNKERQALIAAQGLKQSSEAMKHMCTIYAQLGGIYDRIVKEEAEATGLSEIQLGIQQEIVYQAMKHEAKTAWYQATSNPDGQVPPK